MHYAYFIYFIITITTITIIQYFRKKLLLRKAIGNRILRGKKEHKINNAKGIRNGEPEMMNEEEIKWLRKQAFISFE